MKKYFFDQDDSGHWYMIPADKRDRWQCLWLALGKVAEESNEWYDLCEALNNEFSIYRTGGGIGHIEFIIPD